MTEPKVYVVCPHCGSPSVACDATARWDYETQDWELSSVFDDRTCDDCGHHGSSFDEVTEEGLTVEQRATIYDGADYQAPAT